MADPYGLITSALINSGSSLLGGGINSAAMNAYNKTQMQIAQMNNEYNMRLQNAQNDWNYNQWLRENAYNDPSAQRLRFEKAGINPYMALGNMSSGNAQSLQSAPAQPAVMPNMQPNMEIGKTFQTLGQNALQLFSANAQVEKSMSEANLNNIDAQTRLAENIARLRKVGAEFEAQQLENTFNDVTFHTRQNILDSRLDQINKEIDYTISQTQRQRIDNFIQQTFGLHAKAAEISKLQAEAKKIIQETANMKELLPYEKAEKSAKAIASLASAAHMRAEAYQIYELTDELADYYGRQAEGLNWSNKIEHRKWEDINQYGGIYFKSEDDLRKAQQQRQFLSDYALGKQQGRYKILGGVVSGLGLVAGGAAAGAARKGTKAAKTIKRKSHGFGYEPEGFGIW